MKTQTSFGRRNTGTALWGAEPGPARVPEGREEPPFRGGYLGMLQEWEGATEGEFLGFLSGFFWGFLLGFLRVFFRNLLLRC